MSFRCPTCGMPVDLESSDEGTSHYVPAVTESMLKAAERTWVEFIAQPCEPIADAAPLPAPACAHPRWDGVTHAPLRLEKRTKGATRWG